MKNPYRILAALAGTLLLVALVVPFLNFKQITRELESRKQIRALISSGEELLSQLKDAETGQRGFTLTGDEAFLEPYVLVRDGILGHLEELRRLSSLEAARQSLDSLRPLVVAKLAELKQVIDLRRKHDITTAIAVTRAGKGRALMDAIRAEQRKFIQAEEEALEGHDAALREGMRRLLFIMGGFAVFALLFAFVLVYLVYRESQSRLKDLLHLEDRQLLDLQQAAARQKAEFLSNMSHELRTPLNSIIGFSEVLIDGTFGPLAEKQKDYAGHVLSSGKHLLQLIDQILDMSKIEAAKMHLSVSKVYLGALLKESAERMSAQILKKGLHLSVEVQTGLTTIQGDHLRIKEVVGNLLSNAVNFTPAGGRVGLRAREVAGGVEIEVWDSGIGIAAGDLEKVFEGFFRIGSPPGRQMEGTGLGLSIARKLVELHGGSLKLSSPGLGQGSLARVFLPLVPAKA